MSKWEYIPTYEEALDQIGLDLYKFIKELLNDGLKSGEIRKTPNGEISLYDFLLEVCEKKAAHVVWKRLVEQYPELRTICTNFQFPGKGQRPTPVANLDGLIRILPLVPGDSENAQYFRGLQGDLVGASIAKAGQNDFSQFMSQFTEMTKTISGLKDELGGLNNRLERKDEELQLIRKGMEGFHMELLKVRHLDEGVSRIYPKVLELRRTAKQWEDFGNDNPESWRTVTEILRERYSDLEMGRVFSCRLGQLVSSICGILAGKNAKELIKSNNQGVKLYHPSTRECVFLAYEHLTEVQGKDPLNY